MGPISWAVLEGTGPGLSALAAGAITGLSRDEVAVVLAGEAVPGAALGYSSKHLAFQLSKVRA